MIVGEKLDSVIERFDAVEAQLSAAPDRELFVKLSKEHAELGPVAEAARAFRAAEHEREGLREIVDDPASGKDMVGLAHDELEVLDARLQELEQRLKLLLLPRDMADERNAILEIRAGTGGEEAALFAGNLYRMYHRYADTLGWTVEIISASEADLGGYKEIVARVSGQGVFARLKFESGVHRVQRVPETESGGRIHTSAATVAVLPEAEEVDVTIEDKDLRIDVYRASGPGGQSVNTTDSAVRITHLPSGLVVTQQDEKSQHKNKAKAMLVLRSRLYEAERQRLATERAADRRGQVGTGDRSERIRTYNYPQGRVTDHRINLTLYKLDRIMEGDGLDEIIDALITDHQAQLLAVDQGHAG
jgi:peptide chain release factor 1